MVEARVFRRDAEPAAADPRDAPAAAQEPPRGLLVTGTDTGVGKTVLSAALLAALTHGGVPVRAYKPAVTGVDEPAEAWSAGDRQPAESPGQARRAEPWPHDDELLATLTHSTREQVAPLRFGPAVSPHLAAELAGTPIAGARILTAARRTLAAAAAAGETLIVEGVGGLLVPLSEDLDVRALARDLRLPLLIAARPALGSINHTLLTLEAARAAGLHVRAVVLTPWPAEPSTLERSNRETIARLGSIEVATLPWRRWLGEV